MTVNDTHKESRAVDIAIQESPGWDAP